MITFALVAAAILLFGAARYAPSVPSLVSAGLAVAVLLWSSATPGQAVLAAGAAVTLGLMLRRRPVAS